MILPRFDVLVPESVTQACRMLAEHADEGVRVLAGGTDLLVDLRRPIIPNEIHHCNGCPTHPDGGVLTTVACTESKGDTLAATEPRHMEPAWLVSLHKLKELRSIEHREDGSLYIGTLTTITDIERSPEIRKSWPGLADGADCLGSPLVRNRGTLGGNIVNARPAADMVIPTIALNGELTLRGTGGTRTINAAEFPRGPGISVIKPDEILTGISFPAPSPYSGSAYYKLANRKVLEIATVGVAVWLALEKPNGVVADVRICLGAAGPKPILCQSVKKELVGKIPDDDTVNRVAGSVAAEARAIDDHRGAAWYRVQMIELLTVRLLHKVIRQAQGKA